MMCVANITSHEIDTLIMLLLVLSWIAELNKPVLTFASNLALCFSFWSEGM